MKENPSPETENRSAGQQKCYLGAYGTQMFVTCSQQSFALHYSEPREFSPQIRTLLF